MSNTNSTSPMRSSASVRRGPTLRGGRFRPAIGRSMRRVPQQGATDEEEKIGLTNTSSDDDEEDDDKYQFHTVEDVNATGSSEKVETDEYGKPTYHHGEETFGDLITHPVQELHAHQQRKESYKSRTKRWSALHSPGGGQGGRTAVGGGGTGGGQQPYSNSAPSHEIIQYSIVLHFRQLRGNQRFVLDHDAATDFCERLNFTQQERIAFNGIHDTDGLTEFLYKIKREFSIKIHHKVPHSEHHPHQHHPEHHTIEFNENVYIEFKPKNNHHDVVLSAESTRRPFFQHPEPDLSADIGEEKAASWLELFYDLFFVATLTQFTHSHHITDWSSLGLYAQWFVITWWAWCASSLYTSRFDTDDVVHHIYKLIEMCAVIGMAGSSEYFLNSSGYVYGYIALKGVLAVEYFVVFVVAILAKSKSRIALAFYVGANLLSIALWASSLTILEKGTHRILWYLGVLSEVLVNIIVRGDKTLSWAASHLAERLGLLSLIVLGENLMGLVTLVSVAGNYLIIVVPNFMAVFIIFGFFFMYFEDFNKEIFLHNKYHQIWVYLHFPLHLCQVAFGISLIDILKIYRHQLIRDHKLPEEASTSEGGHGATASGGEQGATAATGEHGTTTTGEGSNTSEHPASASSGTEQGASGTEHGSTSTETAPSAHESAPASHDTTTTTETAHSKAKRAILMVSNDYVHQDTLDYNPMELAQQIKEQQQLDQESSNHWPSATEHWTTWCKYLAASLVTGTLQMISSSSTLEDHESIHNSSGHHLMRRSEPAAAGAEGSFTDTITVAENVFVYKTFLIFAGLILVINSLIKALNTRISDLYGKIIIGSRIINAIVLWSMCALPFAKLDAIVLLCTMVGSLIFQALVDLLD
ncbi:bacterial low temperature requirement A protein-domain-containing protein [Mucor lusitanicus]|uniref:Bacterial low temperature requirement A protein-domain-containing protein n=1 Tax=Mucor circinelloides f. lusitanicus TaxID=29924 RepID=A0A8H4BDH7_MUCCL|nr:bacterial low temperature requirement A protein-domain-containing protein [Mucor lusitanicus]